MAKYVNVINNELASLAREKWNKLGGDSDVSIKIVTEISKVDTELDYYDPDLTRVYAIAENAIYKYNGVSWEITQLGSGVDYLDFNLIDTVSIQEGRLGYDKDNKTLQYGHSNGVVQQIGQEFYTFVCNNTGVDILNGAVVYVNGVDAGCPTIALANADDYEKSRTIGVTTENIVAGAQGLITKAGLVRGINTSGLSLGDVYLSSTDGLLTNTAPTLGAFRIRIGKVLVSNISAGVVLVDINKSELSVEVTDTNGFPEDVYATTTLSYVDGTRTFTIAPTGSDYHFYQDGIKYEKDTSESLVISDVEGLHAIYYDDGVLSEIVNGTGVQLRYLIVYKCIVAYVYWDATNNTSTSYFADERHGISMSPITHAIFHFEIGTFYNEGYAPSNIVSDGNGDLDVSAQFGIGSGSLQDEDIRIISDVVSSGVGCKIYYLDGINADLRVLTNTGFSVADDITAGIDTTRRLVYNDFDGSTWSLKTVTDKDYVLCHIFGINGNDPSSNTIAFIGQNEYSNLNRAREGALTEINNIITVIPVQEIIPIATFIFETRNSFDNAVRARVRKVENGGDDYIDWRALKLSSGTTASSHNNLADLQLAQSTITWGHINDQPQTISGNKTFDATLYNTGIAGSTGGSDMRVVTSTGQIFYDTSSKRFKENIKPIDKSCLDIVDKINIVTYDRKDGSVYGEDGIIAEQLNKVYSSVVNRNKEGLIEGYNKSDLIPILIRAIQEQQIQIDKLYQELDVVKPKIKNKKSFLKKMLDKLRKM